MALRIKVDTIVKQIKERCKELKYTFMGFVGEYNGTKDTYLVLYCNEHKISWNTTTVNSFIRVHTKGCNKST